jgi:hypothetical protein
LVRWIKLHHQGVQEPIERGLTAAPSIGARQSYACLSCPGLL